MGKNGVDVNIHLSSSTAYGTVKERKINLVEAATTNW